MDEQLQEPVVTASHGRARAQGSTAGETAKGGVDWFEAGRLHTGDILWTEDWFVSPRFDHLTWCGRWYGTYCDGCFLAG